MRYYLIAGLLLFQISSFAQIDPRKLDSLRRSIDSSARSMRAWQDSFRWKQDSLYKSEVINETDSTASEHLVQREEKKITYTIVLIGVVFFIVLILVIRGRKRPST